MTVIYPPWREVITKSSQAAAYALASHQQSNEEKKRYFDIVCFCFSLDIRREGAYCAVAVVAEQGDGKSSGCQARTNITKHMAIEHHFVLASPEHRMGAG